MESFKERYMRIKNSPEFKRVNYARRVIAGFISFFIFLFLIPAYFADRIFGISSGISCSIAFGAAVLLGVFLGNKKIQKKYGER